MKNIFRSLYKVFLLLFTLGIWSFVNPAFSFADIGSSWQATATLPDTLASHIAQSYNGKLFVVGGANSVVVPENISSSVNADGTLQPWVSASAPSPAILQQASVIHANHVYLLGGSTYPPTNTQNTVYMGAITSGTISSWTSLNTLPVQVSLASAVVVGNKIYFAGGETELNGGGAASGGVNDKVYAAIINGDGTISSWSQVGTLPVGLYGFNMFTGGTGGNNLIIAGGLDANGTYHNEVYTAPINGDGTVGTWSETSTLPQRLLRASGTVTSNDIVIAGGIKNDGTFSDKVYISTINADGTLQPWFESNTTLPHPTCCSALSELNGFLYLIGGYASDLGYLDTVYVTQATAGNSAPVVNSIPNATINEGSIYTGSGSFTDPDSASWSATVNYADGTGPQPLTLSGNNFSLSHLYKDNGIYGVTVNVTDDQGATGSANATVTVNNVAPTVGSVSVSPSPAHINTSTSASASFTDPGVLDTHTATIDWGDGSSPSTGSVSENNGSGTVTGSHTYTSYGAYTVTVTVKDNANATGSNTGNVTVVKQLTALNPATMYISRGGGVLNSFNIKAEVYKDSTFITSGVTNVNPFGTTAVAIPFTTFSPVDFPSGSALKIKVSACSTGGILPGAARLHYNAANVDSRFGATIDGASTTYHLRSGLVLSTSAGNSAQTVNANANCSAYTSFGTWSVTL